MHSLFLDFTKDDFMMLTTLNNHCSDDVLFKNVVKNYKIDLNNLIRLNQVHSNNILIAENPGLYDKYDGIIINTTQKKLIPMIQTADCIPLFLYDKKNKIYGLIHCGWRGIVSKIHIKAVKKMILLDSEINNIKIVAGPSIKSCCYEVGSDILDNFYKDSIEEKKGKYYLNLINQINYDLEKMGIKCQNVKFSDTCTYHDKNCHSFRRDGKNAGRMYSIISPL